MIRASRCLLMVLLLFACSPSAPVKKENSRVNLLVYLVDTLRADHLGVYGYERDTSPVIDRVASEGVVFDNVFVQSNWTQPSVGSIITSQPPLFFSAFADDLPDSVLTMAEILKEAGYATGGFTTNTAVAPEFNFDQGFDCYKEAGAEFSVKVRTRREGSEFDADTLNNMALPWIEEQAKKEEPFFLYIHSVDPHVPYSPPEAFDLFGKEYQGFINGSVDQIVKIKKEKRELSDADKERIKALYDGEIRFNDFEIGRLLKEMKRLGALENTLVVILSDHGEELFERGTTGHGHKNLFKELTRVPLIMHFPGKLPPGSRVKGLVSGMDVLPTVLDLVGVPKPEGLFGRSLVPFITPKEPKPFPPEELFAFRIKEFQDLCSLRTESYLYLWHPKGERALFNIKKEPHEKGKDLLSFMTPAQQKVWDRKMLEYYQLRMEREIEVRFHSQEGETEIPEELKDRLKALGYLK